jgi:type I restriction enzyme, S subunit
MFDCIRAGMDESRKLAEMRDYLLSKLLSGQVRAREAETLTEAVA